MTEETKLIEEAKAGRGEAFGKLYDQYVAPIYRFVLVRVSNRAEAEDLTQHVFLKAWQNIRRYREREGIPFTSWLYRIARNAVIDHYRTRRDHEDIEGAAARNLAEDFPVQEVEYTLQIEEVHRAFVVLTPGERDVILLRFMEELSVKEVAAILEKSEGTIRVMQHRGLKKLKGELGAGN